MTNMQKAGYNVSLDVIQMYLSQILLTYVQLSLTFYVQLLLTFFCNIPIVHQVRSSTSSLIEFRYSLHLCITYICD